MFSKKAQTDVKKSAHKILDPKKDTATRFKHLKFLLGMFAFKINFVYLQSCRKTNLFYIYVYMYVFFQTIMMKMNQNIYLKIIIAVFIKFFMKVSSVLKQI